MMRMPFARATLAAMVATISTRGGPTLTVWTFPSARGARRALDRLRRKRATIRDAAIIAWPRGRTEPETSEFRRMTAGTTDARLWPQLFDAVLGETSERLFGELGVDATLIEQLRVRLRPGTSALFVVR